VQSVPFSQTRNICEVYSPNHQQNLRVVWYNVSLCCMDQGDCIKQMNKWIYELMNISLSDIFGQDPSSLPTVSYFSRPRIPNPVSHPVASRSVRRSVLVSLWERLSWSIVRLRSPQCLDHAAAVLSSRPAVQRTDNRPNDSLLNDQVLLPVSK